MEFLLTNDVAKELAVSVDTVRWYARTGRLPSLRTVGGVRLFRRTDVERFLAARMQQGSTQGSDDAWVAGSQT